MSIVVVSNLGPTFNLIKNHYQMSHYTLLWFVIIFGPLFMDIKGNKLLSRKLIWLQFVTSLLSGFQIEAEIYKLFRLNYVILQGNLATLNVSLSSFLLPLQCTSSNSHASTALSSHHVSHDIIISTTVIWPSLHCAGVWTHLTDELTLLVGHVMGT